MNTIVFLLALIGSTAAKTAKIWNGLAANQVDFQYMAALKNAQGQLVCGGAILSTRWILSAAHCDTRIVSSGGGGGGGPVLLSIPDSGTSGTSVLRYVGVGNVDLTQQTNYVVDFTIPNPVYFSNSRLGDVLLVKTTTKIEMTPNLVTTIPINSNTNDDLKSMSSMKISGWGLYQAPNNKTLMYTTYSNQKQNYCWQKNNDGNIGMPFSPEIDLCAIASSSTPISPNGICSGDTGGPLVYNGLVFGVAQRFMNDPCASNFPDVFTRVAYYSSWIYSVINGNM